MGQRATLRRVSAQLAHNDRGHYATLDIRVSQHPSETTERLVIRLLARILEDDEGLAFGGDLSCNDEPALWRHNDVGELVAWIEVGKPSRDRVHKATKRCESVVIYTPHSLDTLQSHWGSQRIHRTDRITVVQVPEALVDGLAELLERTDDWMVSVDEDTLSVYRGERAFEGQLLRTQL